MDKVWILLLTTSPFLAFFAWAGWWLITDACRERRWALVAVRDHNVECRGVTRSMDEAA